MPSLAIDESISQVAAEIAAGHGIGTVQIARDLNLNVASIFRWIVRGLPGPNGDRIRLTAIRRGKKWISSRPAVERFFASLPASGVTSAPRSNNAPQDRSADARAKAADAAAQRLRDEHGL